MSESAATEARLPFMGLVAVQLFVGYEWLISGLTKIVRGGFPAGLADELTEKSEGAPGWYVSFLNDVVIPHGKVFGYVTEIGEFLGGVALIGGGLVWLLAWRRLGPSARVGTLATVTLAALAGAFMNLNFHWANGSAHPWLLPGSGFDEGVDLDSLDAGHRTGAGRGRGRAVAWDAARCEGFALGARTTGILSVTYVEALR